VLRGGGWGDFGRSLRRHLGPPASCRPAARSAANQGSAAGCRPMGGRAAKTRRRGGASAPAWNIEAARRQQLDKALPGDARQLDHAATVSLWTPTNVTGELAHAGAHRALSGPACPSLHPGCAGAGRARAGAALQPSAGGLGPGAQAGRHLVVATPTASGKTLCYNLPVLDAVLSAAPRRCICFRPRPWRRIRWRSCRS
jgi:hypothetical protein